jgi:Fe-S-cluster-containing hydrogenase component 2
MAIKCLKTPLMERCIGCHSCSLACARLVYKRLSWDTAGIRIFSSGGLSTGFEAKHCLGCNPAPCASVCPTRAFSLRKGGGIIVQRKLCIRCGECARACPVDAIYLDDVSEPFVCIHCGRCISFCPHHCLEMVEVSVDPPRKIEESVVVTQ